MMNKYSKLTDAEINKLIAIIENTFIEPPNGLCTEIIDDILHYYDEMRVIFDCHPDYCSSWADTGPLIEKFGLDVDGDFQSVSQNGSYAGHFAQADNKNLLRAICECILLINDRG